tara:strand:+ start:812 stop:1936 length:1125 start_codon:yes stop_codon:yes gene_type:complete
MAVINLTDARIRALELGSGIHRDEKVKGLMVICHATTKTYAVQGDVRRNGRHIRTVRTKIDRVDRISLSDARRKAMTLMSQIQSGIDPTDGPDETGITLIQVLEAHLKERELRPSTVQSYQDHVDKYLKRFRSRAVADITRQDCRELLETLTARHGRTTAAGVLRTLRALINTAMRLDETILRSPMDAVRVPVPPKRQVDALDIADFWKRSEALSPMMRDIHRTMLLTGARRSSVLTLRREDIDLEKRVMTFSHMKTGGQLMFPMGPVLTGIIAKRMDDDTPLNSTWLWPSPLSTKGHIVEPKRANVASPHALRHHARTLMIAAGVPYAESALLLGHKLPGATGGYVHAEHLVEALRPHAEAYERLVMEKLKNK